MINSEPVTDSLLLIIFSLDQCFTRLIISPGSMGRVKIDVVGTPRTRMDAPPRKSAHYLFIIDIDLYHSINANPQSL